MTELRQKMIRAMELKNLSPHTQRAHLASAKGLARHYRQSPTAISKEMIEDYLLALKKSSASNSCGLVLTGVRFFYANVAEEKLQVDYRTRKKLGLRMGFAMPTLLYFDCHSLPEAFYPAN